MSCLACLLWRLTCRRVRLCVVVWLTVHVRNPQHYTFSATVLLLCKLNLLQCHKFRNSYKIKNYSRILTHVRCLIITCIIISCNCDVRVRGICSQLLSQPQNIHSCKQYDTKWRHVFRKFSPSSIRHKFFMLQVFKFRLIAFFLFYPKSKNRSDITTVNTFCSLD